MVVNFMKREDILITILEKVAKLESRTMPDLKPLNDQLNSVDKRVELIELKVERLDLKSANPLFK